MTTENTQVSNGGPTNTAGPSTNVAEPVGAVLVSNADDTHVTLDDKAEPQVKSPVITKQKIEAQMRDVAAKKQQKPNPTVVQQTPEQTAAAQQKANNERQRDPNQPGYEQVDFGKISDPALRKAVEDRFGNLYHQVRQSNREFQTLKQYNEAMQARLDQLENAHNSDAFQQREAALDSLKDAANAAFASGDHAKGSELLQQLIRDENAYLFEKQQFEQESAAAKAAKEKPPVSNEPPELADLKRPEVQQLVSQWQSQREYAQPNHPWYQHTAKAMHHILTTRPDLSWEQVLNYTDKYITTVANKQRGSQGQNVQQNNQNKTNQPPIVQQVLSQNSGARPNNNAGKSTLSDAEKRVAERLFSNLSPSEAHAKYTKGKGK